MVWRLGGFLHKTMQHDDALPDQRAEEDSCNSLRSLESQFEKALTKCLGMWFSEVGAKSNHPACEHNIPCRERVGKRENLFLHQFAVVNNRVIHIPIKTNMLYYEICYLIASAKLQLSATGMVTARVRKHPV
jgi:hypothetical protein